MSDILDQTDFVEESVRNLTIQAIRSKGRELHPVGECHWCGEPFEKDSKRLFCPGHQGPSDCATDWERNKPNR